MEKSKFIKFIISFSGILIFFLSWYLISKNLPNFLLPSPISTFQETYKTFFSSDFWHNAGLTLSRTFITVFIAFLLGNLLAIASNISVNFKHSLWPLIIFGLYIPPIIEAFIAVVILGSRGPVGIVVPVLVITPILFVMLYPAYKNLSKEFAEVAKVFHISKHVYLKNVVFPQLTPYLFAALRTCISDGWKLTILTEIFTLGDGVGSRILHYFNLFSIREVFAWTISFLVIMIIIEYGVVQQLEKKLIHGKITVKLL